MTYDVSRRSLLALGAGLGATMIGGSALARAPKLGTQSPYFHRFILGGAEVTVVSDGQLPLGPPKGTFTGVPDEEIRKMLSDNFLSPDNVVLEQNSPIVNMGDKLVLFDTGMGTSQLFGPTTGRQQKSMMEAGIKPEDIDAVVFSHAHVDHIGGVVDESGKVLFPHAQFYIAQSDFDYVIIETVGTGQEAMPFQTGLVDKTVLVMNPDYGSRLQLQKIVMLDLADIVVVNKSDQERARTASSEIGRRLDQNKRSQILVSTVANRHRDAGVETAAGQPGRWRTGGRSRVGHFRLYL